MKTVYKFGRTVALAILALLTATCADETKLIVPDRPQPTVQPTEGDQGLLTSGGRGSFIGTPVPLTEKFRTTVNGGYRAAGVSLRGKGSGTIQLNLPDGSTIEHAFLYWSVMRSSFHQALRSGTLNGIPVTGSLIGSTGDPCWSPTSIHNFKADVTSLTEAGVNHLSGFATGNTLPGVLLEGASLIVIYERPGDPRTEVILEDGAVSFVNPPPVEATHSNFLVAGQPLVRSTFVVADGQRTSPDINNRILVNEAQLAENSLTGADPPTGSQYWDTETHEITNFLSNNDEEVTVAIESNSHGSSFDCLTWVAQVLSISRAGRGLGLVSIDREKTHSLAFATDVATRAQYQAHTVVGRGFNQPGLSVTLRELPSTPGDEAEEFPIRSNRLSINDNGTELLAWARVGLEPGDWEIELETQRGQATHPFRVVAQSDLQRESGAGWYYPLQRPLNPPLNERTMYITAGWLARHPDYRPDPRRKLAHLGTDLRAPVGTEVYAIGDGVVHDTQGPGMGWGEDNVAVAVRHQSAEGPFIAVYGHLEAESAPEGVLVEETTIERGQLIGKTGPFGTGAHLHFVIHPRPEDFPDSGWGIIESSQLDENHFTRGFVDPLHWIETVRPGLQ